MATILEIFKVAPPTGAVAERTLPLVHFDIVQIHLVGKALFFYQLPSSDRSTKSHFLDTIIPDLKNSLSLTLKHFFPLAGNLLFPLDSNSEKKPVCRYVPGDFVSLAIAESNADFIHLTGDHARDANIYHAFMPLLSPKPTSCDDEYISYPAAAMQVTLFPNQGGICIGFANQHSIADGKSAVDFIQTWSSINKYNGGGDESYDLKHLPFYDRTTVEDPNGLDLTLWNQMKMARPKIGPPEINSDIVQATFIVSEDNVTRLKRFVLEKLSPLTSVSTFIVVCAYLWVSFVKSSTEEEEGGVSDENEIEYFLFPIDCRTRLDPPLPTTFFGNCVAVVKAETTRGKLKGNDGVVAAAEAISEAIHKTLHDEKGILDGVLNRFNEIKRLAGKRALRLAGSPRFDFYSVDFGWGKSKKFELITNDLRGIFGLIKSREDEGGVHVCYSQSKIQIERLTTIFNQDLKTYF